jgi:hypothetical protein
VSYSVGEFPDFSWSQSRAQSLLTCARKYYLSYYAGHRGWELRSPEPARLAYRLKQLTTLDMELGAAVHRRANERLRAMLTNASGLSLEEAAARTRDELNRIWKNGRRRAAFEADPKRNPMTRGAYYGQEASAESIQSIRRKLGVCLSRLYDAPIWAELKACSQEDVRTIDNVVSFFTDEGIRVYVAPDLVYRDRDGVWTIVDWKTGAESDVEFQMALYAWYCQRELCLPASAQGYRTRVVWLWHGRETIGWVDAPQLRHVEVAVVNSIAQMRSLVVDIDRNQPSGVEAFPMVEELGPCQRCNFAKPCGRFQPSEAGGRLEASHETHFRALPARTRPLHGLP